ncbi:Outer membrane receptor proteins, mostly Fe transport [Chishuiella changwenlii]|uniref:Collagen-binding protein n=1 Tax=Chishuiella changwenlii TaxID=1434701 RepID=A0A1M6YSP1_9FLAO|nr:TonB-dependent receptor plug domain-containing protein [Chishuiella changwenlii]GGE88395.1 collagen-binding protein [Chishuiella changwenlii]SHL21059.1 Outer membrane receptor proteins, mostly Fe transport [Chishuiella changwenlii]
MKKTSLACFALLVGSSFSFAQEKFTISGTIKEKSSGETMNGIRILTVELPDFTATSNSYGFYSLTLPKGEYNLTFNTTDTISVALNDNVKLDHHIISFKADETELKEVVMTVNKKNNNLNKTSIGVEKLDIKEIDKLPVIFGEKDILKTIQLMPGIQSGGDGNSGFFVRGGNADQNLILLDEAPVYNASHLLGFFSTFNSDALKDVTIIKGNNPAQYGGRLSSVLDVSMKEGNNQKYNVSGGIGLISSRLSIEGPIQKSKSSFIVSARRTYADMFLKLSDTYKNNSLFFYDFNAKANIWINDNNRIFISGYFGKDVLGYGKEFNNNWGNTTGTIRWNSIISPKLFSNTSLIYSNYDYKISLNEAGSNLNVNSNIRDYNLKQEFEYNINTKNKLSFGFNTIHHTITPNRFQGNESLKDENKRQGLESSLFVSNNNKINKKLTLDYGIRLSSYSIIGKGSYNVYNKDSELVNQINLSSGKFGKTYFNVEPRLQFSYMLNNYSSIKGGYARNTQHLHLQSNSTAGFPTDQWIGNSYNIKPEISDQISLGYFRNSKNRKYQFSGEVYYKSLQNQIDYKDGADLIATADIESEFAYGKGRAYGLELLAKKTSGRLTGWIGYTLSKTERKIDGVNNNNWYRARQDRTHDLSIVTMYDLTKRWSLSSAFVYSTGNAVTYPNGKYEIEGQTIYNFNERNASRVPSYHRLDISATYKKPHKGKYESSWNIGVYNVYGRQNPYIINFEDSGNRSRSVQTSLFKMIPSITYNFKF